MSWAIINLSLCLSCVLFVKKGGKMLNNSSAQCRQPCCFLGHNTSLLKHRVRNKKRNSKAVCFTSFFFSYSVNLFPGDTPFGRFLLGFPLICPQMSHYILPQITNDKFLGGMCVCVVGGGGGCVKILELFLVI